MKINLVGTSVKSLQSVYLHSHGCWEIVLNTNGRGVTQIGDAEYSFGEGTIICQPPDVPHSKTADTGFRDIYIQIEEFENVFGDDVPIFYDDEDKSFEMLMSLALRLYYKKDNNYVSALNSLYGLMYQLLLSWSGGTKKNSYVELFKNILINNFTDPQFKPSDAMNKISYCGDYFRRCFRNETGMTPTSYLLKLRMDYAQSLLSQNKGKKMSVSDIAYLSGFYDSRYFSRVFKKTTGRSPRDFVTDNSDT